MIESSQRRVTDARMGDTGSRDRISWQLPLLILNVWGWSLSKDRWVLLIVVVRNNNVIRVITIIIVVDKHDVRLLLLLIIIVVVHKLNRLKTLRGVNEILLWW